MKRRKQGPSAAHILGIGVAALAMAGMLAYALMVDPPLVYDKTTLCPKQYPGKNHITAINVLLIDRTDKVTEIQAKDIQKSLTELAAESRAHEKFLIYEIVSSATVGLRPLLELCNPGKVDDTTIAGKLETTPISKRIFQERFLGALESILSRLLTIEPQRDSPIMEMLQASVVQDLKHAPKGMTKRLVIVSDLMQHSSNYSQYMGLNEKSFFSGPASRQLTTDLSGIDIRVLYIPRLLGPSSQPAGHKEFWSRFFNELGGQSTTILPVEGGGWVKSATGTK